MFTAVKAFLLRVLAMLKLSAATAVDGTLTDAVVMLYTNGVGPDINSTFASLTEATFDGYARSSVVVWGTPYTSETTGFPVMQGDAKIFACTGDTVTETVKGVAILSADVPPILLALKTLDTQWQPSSGEQITILPRVSFSPDMVVPGLDPATS